MSSTPTPTTSEDPQVLVTLKLSSKLLTQISKKSQPQSVNSTPAPTTPTPTPKPGPTRGASNVATNAGLRALDRSGTPARKWTKAPVELRSFTGVKYEIETWSGGPRAESDIKPEEKTPAPSRDSTPSNSAPGTPHSKPKPGGSMLSQAPMTPNSFSPI